MREATLGVLLRVPFRVVSGFQGFFSDKLFGSSFGQPDGKERGGGASRAITEDAEVLASLTNSE